MEQNKIIFNGFNVLSKTSINYIHVVGEINQIYAHVHIHMYLYDKKRVSKVNS